MNYIHDHPLNLIGRVAIVTSASSELGAAICRSLLNSNAFVLGIDSKPAHETTRSTAASHFQFVQYNEQVGLIKNEIVDMMKRRFLNDRIAFLVDVVNGYEDQPRIAGVEDLVRYMEGEGEDGLVLKVWNESVTDIQVEKHALSKLKETKLRHNLLVSQDVEAPKSHGQKDVMDAETREALVKHLEDHKAKREKGNYQVQVERDLANLVLFCCAKWGEGLDGLVIGKNGNCY